jgi:hypothetical protein
MEGLLAQTARDVAEHVLDLVAEDDQNYDDHDSDQDEDKGVLDHTLPFLTVEQFAKPIVDGGKHLVSPPVKETGPSVASNRSQEVKALNALCSEKVTAP